MNTNGLLGKYMLYDKVEGAEEMQQAAEQIVDRSDQRFFWNKLVRLKF